MLSDLLGAVALPFLHAPEEMNCPAEQGVHDRQSLESGLFEVPSHAANMYCPAPHEELHLKHRVAL